MRLLIGLRSVMCFLMICSSRGMPASTSMEVPGVEMWNASRLPERRAAGESALVVRGGGDPIGDAFVRSGEGGVPIIVSAGIGKDGHRKAQTLRRKRA